MSLFEKAGKFDALVSKLSNASDKKSSLQAVQRTQNLAAKFDAKLARIAQAQTFPDPSGAGVNSPYVPGTEPPVSQGPAAPAGAAPAINAPAPAVKAPAQAPGAAPSYDAAAINSLQDFLNRALADDIIAGKLSPLVVDGKLGPDTTNSLKYWGKQNQIQARTVPELLQIALNKTPKAAPKAAPAAPKAVASVKQNLISLANKFDNKYAQNGDPAARIISEFNEVKRYFNDVNVNQDPKSLATEIARVINNGTVEQLVKTVQDLSASGYWK